MKIKFFYILLITSFYIQVSEAKEFTTEDFVYEDGIKTALLFPYTGSTNPKQVDMLNPPIVSLSQESPLMLQFDEMGSDINIYYLKIINCNADWTVSQLNAIQYLNEYNEYQITEREASFNTRTPYIHYRFFLPKVKVSGNYVVMVYRDTNQDDIILTRRFSVFEDLVAIAPEVKFSVVTSERNRSQQVDFRINYGRVDIINPMQNLKVVLRKNHRWDNAITNLRPSFVSEDIKKLDYLFFNNENAFKGVNEFRFFDIRSNRFSGVNVNSTSFDPNKIEVTLGIDRNKGNQAYSLTPDFMEGKFAIENYESGDRETQPDYAYVTFVLDNPPLEEDVYVFGALTGWRTEPQYKMEYNTAINKYICRILLKQGYYNYRYVLGSGKSKDETYFEGNFSQTQNIYDILVYFRPFGTLSDRLVGYTSINYLGR